MTKIDTPKILKKPAIPPPPTRESREKNALLERLFRAILTGIVSQAESADPDESGQDRHGFSDEDLNERDDYLIARSLGLAILAEEKFREELELRRFNKEV